MLKRFLGDRKSIRHRKTHSLKPLGIALERFRACINILVLFSFSIICPVISWREGHENVREQCPTVWDCVFFGGKLCVSVQFFSTV